MASCPSPNEAIRLKRLYAGMLITALAVTAAIVTAALWLLVRSSSVMALSGLVDLWVAQSWRQNASDWEAAYWRDTGELQKELQRLRPTQKARLPDDGGVDQFHFVIMASARPPPGSCGRPESLDAPPQSTRSTTANPDAKDSIGYLAWFRSPSARMHSDQPQGIISSYQYPKYQNQADPTPVFEAAFAAKW